MAEKVKVLYFVDRMLRGGIQTFVIENMKYFDKDKIQIDYLLLDDGVEYELEKELVKLGANVYKLKNIWIRKLTDYIKYNKELDNFFCNHHDYHVIHMHSSSKNYMVLKKAKKYGIPVRIAHSHNIGFQSKNKLQILLGNILKKPLKKYATNYFACSEMAGKWLFGKKTLQRGKVKIIHNAVDLEKFDMDKKRRDEIRKELGIQKKLVIGHVGRFTEQKNHTFLIDIFSEIHKLNKDTTLMLVGIGEKENNIKQKVESLGLKNDVLFMGFKNNVNELMWAMDLFVFPSNFEGLGLVLIEAQATGMPCFTSKDVVPEEAKVTDLLQFISLDNNANEWANIIMSADANRKDKKDQIIEKGYLIEDTAKCLQEFYLNT